jgi:hypothetical protein
MADALRRGRCSKLADYLQALAGRMHGELANEMYHAAPEKSGAELEVPPL